ncbi:pyridoxamine 5'-phosphate oxidase family protein [Mycolicibacterium parafortuitum]|uniref:Pyridoxamine 5'-phosphate oxidase-related FMN-binding protein [Gordonia sp. KTR9] n=1 Tax=Mycolicibacterium parafortuitum TaxID=39692 RepID=A0A375YCM4_MYCPF|nr:pyridoxamine 5'-phosphate oxidase family protein [Mycolicibacterium parafortuitum]ORB30751.1 pyridoxamine 5'-phosphate oxidase [Mycolicibacterium parafortuitum]SRX78829.1 pyridoxamine 5'-phosphate oxidase-related FMN-binding protein [Gordonia sp. KTR9] [Mycolicibacterium parafortuitum]
MDVKTSTDAPVTVLSDSESWDLLGSVSLGRLVTTVNGWTEIFPVNFVVQKNTVLFRTAEGTKLLTTALNEYVVFEADDHNLAEGWSVVVRGKARLLATSTEIAEARRASLYPWIATQKERFVRITPQTVTGRRFVFGPEPDATGLSS